MPVSSRIVQGVSYPQPNFYHFRATDIWLTGADPAQILPTGWAGGYLDEQYPHFPNNYPNPDMYARPTGDPAVGSRSFHPHCRGPALTMGAHGHQQSQQLL